MMSRAQLRGDRINARISLGRECDKVRTTTEYGGRCTLLNVRARARESRCIHGETNFPGVVGRASPPCRGKMTSLAYRIINERERFN